MFSNKKQALFYLEELLSLPTVLCGLIDECLHVYCQGCGANLLPVHDLKFNIPPLDDIPLHSACSLQQPNYYHLKSTECLYNVWINHGREVVVADPGREVTYKLHVEVYRIEKREKNRIWWHIECNVPYDKSWSIGLEPYLVYHPFRSLHPSDMDTTTTISGVSTWTPMVQTLIGEICSPPDSLAEVYRVKVKDYNVALSYRCAAIQHLCELYVY